MHVRMCVYVGGAEDHLKHYQPPMRQGLSLVRSSPVRLHWLARETPKIHLSLPLYSLVTSESSSLAFLHGFWGSGSYF